MIAIIVDRISLLEMDIDLRLLDLWSDAEEVEEWNLQSVSAFMRASYGKGYKDALEEEVPATLHREPGYKIPERRRAR